MNAKNFIKSIIPLMLLAAVLLSGCSALQYKTQSSDIRAIADQIAGYSVPEGYSEQFAATMLGYQLVSLTGPTPSCHIYLVQAPKDAADDMEKLQEQARTLRGEKSKNDRKEMRVVEKREATIRGQQVTLLVSEGINSEDLPYREITAIFTARGGPALVSISSPVTYWDDSLVDQFIASIE